MRLVDSHAHLDADDLAGDLAGVRERARAAGVERVVCIGLWRGPGDFGNARDLAAVEPGFYSATVGIHPHECARVPEADWEACRRLALDPRVVGVGETGLDFHYDHSPRPDQERSFRRSIAMAREVGKPVVVHVREADEICARVLREEGVPPAGGVIHCFTGDWPAAKAYLDLGLLVSVAGVVTFKNAEPIREAVRRIPRDRLLVETDSPYLTPVPFRGWRNEPAHVAQVAGAVAALWSVAPEEAARATAENALRFFRIAA
jgi:TatD DNase family protein